MALSKDSPIGVVDFCQNSLWLQIFKRLPVKSVCRCRCVCKSWNSLLSSRFFTALHHNFTTSKTLPNHKPYFLLNMRQPHTTNRPVFALYHPQRERDVHITCLDLPFLDDENLIYRLRVIGVIHGVVCLVSKSSTFVWNPTTRKYISLKNRKYGGCCHDFGFGFDSRNNDFKVVRIVFPWYDVFSVDDGAWRESVATDNVKGYKPIYHRSSCFMDGNIYWITCKKTSIQFRTGCHPVSYTFALLLFDCELEQFKTIELPQHFSQNDPFSFEISAHLFKYGDMLSVIKPTSDDSNCYELWAMEEEKTWKKLFTIEQSICFVDKVIMLGRDLDPLLPSLEELSSAGFAVDLRGFHQPLNGQICEESLFLTDVKEKKALQQANKQEHQDGKVYSAAYKLIPSFIGRLFSSIAKVAVWFGFSLWEVVLMNF